MNHSYPVITRDALLIALMHHVGRENGITARRLVLEITDEWSSGRERDLRHAVEALRGEGIPVVATPAQGYYIARDAGELHETLSFLRRRALCSLVQIRQLKRLALPALSGQTRFNT